MKRVLVVAAMSAGMAVVLPAFAGMRELTVAPDGLSPREALLAIREAKAKGDWSNNLWFDVRGESAATIGGGTWAAWTQLGFEKDGSFADPQFVDAANNDFRLKPSSPAFALGFRSWDYSSAGRQRKEDRK